ncbi:MAG: thioredoxin family protein [Solirubrobacteraceae bacterium]|nr:thioredoxin family protein [Patulibacter sp.]
MPLTLERRARAFEQAIAFDAFVDGTVNHTAAFRENHDAVEFTDADRVTLGQITDSVDVLAIVENWCPDVVANLPIVARIAEASPHITLHVLVRGPETEDVANAYPFEGRSHIPTYVLFGSTGEELGVIVERTAEIGGALPAFLDAFFAKHPEIDRAEFPGNVTDDVKAELSTQSLQLRKDLRSIERSTFVRDLTRIATGDAASVASGAGIPAVAQA